MDSKIYTNREVQLMSLAFNHAPGGAIFDTNNLHLKASPELLEVGRNMERLDVLMNYSDTGRKLKSARPVYPICPGCTMVANIPADKMLCRDCED